MRDIAYYNGTIGRIDEVMAPITDRVFTLATVFTTPPWCATRKSLHSTIT